MTHMVRVSHFSERNRSPLIGADGDVLVLVANTYTPTAVLVPTGDVLGHQRCWHIMMMCVMDRSHDVVTISILRFTEAVVYSKSVKSASRVIIQQTRGRRCNKPALIGNKGRNASSVSY